MIRNAYLKFLLIIPLCFASCSEVTEVVNSGDHQNQNNGQQNYTSPYMGKWVGTYSGNAVSGALILNVSKSGSIEVTRTADGTAGEVYYTSLQHSGSALNPAPSPKGFILYGSLYTGSGTWSFQNQTGSWSVTKQ